MTKKIEKISESDRLRAALNTEKNILAARLLEINYIFAMISGENIINNAGLTAKSIKNVNSLSEIYPNLGG